MQSQPIFEGKDCDMHEKPKESPFGDLNEHGDNDVRRG